MSERDTDIEFDFFDEPETEEATERVRSPRRPPPLGPRRPVRPPAGFIPMLRVVVDWQGAELHAGGNRDEGERARGEDQGSRGPAAAGGGAGPQPEPARPV